MVLSPFTALSLKSFRLIIRKGEQTYFRMIIRNSGVNDAYVRIVVIGEKDPVHRLNPWNRQKQQFFFIVVQIQQTPVRIRLVWIIQKEQCGSISAGSAVCSVVC